MRWRRSVLQPRPFSLLLAREANVFVRDDAFAAEMMGHLRYAIARQAGASRRRACAALARHAHGELVGLCRHAPDDHAIAGKRY